MMLSRRSVAPALGLLSTVSAMKTSIFIDQISAYSKLPGCAQDQLSAIIRAQASGCGDNQQLTSYSCFCIDQSTNRMMASIISTAVQSSCAAGITATASLSNPLPQVTSAIDVFNSYCARTTELSLYQNPVTTGPVTVTVAPNSTPSIASATSTPISSSNSNSSNTVPVAAIAAPVVIGILAIATVAGFFFWLRRRRAAQENSTIELSGSQNFTQNNPPSYALGGVATHEHYGSTRELRSHTPVAQEVGSDIMKYRHELGNQETVEPVELYASETKGGVKSGLEGHGEKGGTKGWAIGKH
ncbi:hypothetical protein CC80DRAFT_501292 [Byssothecium circinans]|uniref:Uncharacterized protein n=1 Tax=Byssothecium circinans TaxID=147558 RepID=A0A6A5U543_9PLEO|nr:hypothetical protein CC80DRAFT_501292 [Byssothecium circinans]